MDEKTKARFEEILGRKRAFEINAENEREAQLKRDRDLEDRKRETSERWHQQTLGEITRAVASANDLMKGQGATFSVVRADRKDPPGLCRLPIHLHMEDQIDRAIYLNVSETGTVKAVFTIPHSGKSPPDFTIYDATEDFFAELLANFLGQVIDSQATKRR